jgi:hypothetical protein
MIRLGRATGFRLPPSSVYRRLMLRRAQLRAHLSASVQYSPAATLPAATSSISSDSG